MRKFLLMFLVSISILMNIYFLSLNLKEENIVKQTISAESKESGTVKTEKPIEKQNVLNYEEYSHLFEKINENFRIPHYNLVNSTLGDDIIMIDKEISFNTRQYLTLKGESNLGDIKSTQESLFFMTEDMNDAIIITLAYTDSYVGNDAVLYNSINDYGLTEELENNNDLLVLSYKNLIISILQTSTSKVDYNFTNLAALKLIDFLEN